MIREAEVEAASPGDLNLPALLALLRRERRKVLRIVAATLALALAYAVFAPRAYVSETEILVATRPKDVLAPSPGPETLVGPVDPGLIESQVEILKSASVGLAVVRRLKLLDDDVFMGRDRFDPLGAIRHLLSPLFGARIDGDPVRLAEQRATEALADKLKVKRIGMTYVVDVQYTARTPDLAFRIVEALAQEYIEGELRARYDNSRRATDWFRARLTELEKDVADADHEAQKYRAQNNIVDTPRGRLDEQQLSDMSQQLAAAETATADARARAERAAAAMDADLADAPVSDALKSDAIAKLRAQYVALSARRRELAARFGEDHRLVADVARAMQDVRRAAHEEMRRLVEAERNDLSIALSRESQLRDAVSRLVARFAELNDSQVALRRLESNVKAYRDVYDASLEKFQLNAQAQAAPLELARVIAPANYPDRAAWPRASLVMLAGLALGVVAAVTTTVAQEVLCDRFRWASDVRDYAGLPCLGVLPRLSAADLPPAAKTQGLGAQSPLARIALSDPFSAYAKTVRDVNVSIDLTRPPGECVTIGVLSTRHGEGKTTLAANLALVAARAGRRTLLIDGDLHSFRLTQVLAPSAQAGLLQALAQPGASTAFCALDAPTGLRFLPAVAGGRLYNAAEILRSRSMARTLEAARGEFDYVFVDLPALQSDIDARAAAALFDGFIYVIEAGATSRRAVREALAELAPVRARIVGAVLSMADASAG